MEVKRINDGLLTNIEVLDLLKEKQTKRNAYDLTEKCFQTPASKANMKFEAELLCYLQQSVLGELSSEHILPYLTLIKEKKLNLTEGEMIQLANFIPTQDVEIHTVCILIFLFKLVYNVFFSLNYTF